MAEYKFEKKNLIDLITAYIQHLESKRKLDCEKKILEDWLKENSQFNPGPFAGGFIAITSEIEEIVETAEEIEEHKNRRLYQIKFNRLIQVNNYIAEIDFILEETNAETVYVKVKKE